MRRLGVVNITANDRKGLKTVLTKQSNTSDRESMHDQVDERIVALSGAYDNVDIIMKLFE